MSIPVVPYAFTLDVTNRKNPGVPAIIVVTGDTGTRQFNVTLKNNGLAIDITDLTPRIYFEKADGNRTQGDPTVVDAPTGQISYTLHSNDVSKVGRVDSQITLSDASGNKVTTFEFSFNVVKSAYSDAAVESTNEFSLLTQYVDNFKHFGEYDSGTTYYINNVVEYNGSSFIALQTTEGNDPPTYPDTYNDYWYLMAKGYPVTVAAENTTLADTRGYYDAGRNFTTSGDISDVEAALKDLGAFKRVVPETGWVYSSDSDPIIVLKKPVAEYTMLYPSGGFGTIGAYADLSCSIAGGQSGLVVDVWKDASYTYAAIMLLTNGSTSGPSPFPGSSDTFSASFSPVLAPPVGRSRVYLDNDNFVMRWVTGDNNTPITPDASWQEIDSNFRITIPAYGDYFVKCDIAMIATGTTDTGVFVSITNDISGTVSSLGLNAITAKTVGDGNTSMEHNFHYQKQFMIAGTGTAQTIYFIGWGTGAQSLRFSNGGGVYSVAEVWPACLPVLGGVAV